ncbi:hypothetical protein [Streptomyces wuyuanensis]|uniref:hypothetical protein n=1 Tax=Streptomyces wuyuanensis TaxID=1196353 RepID=UPI00342A4D76
MPHQAETTPIQERYATQFAADLKRNEEERAALQERLQQLDQEHAWLTSVLEATPAIEQETVPVAEKTDAGKAAATTTTNAAAASAVPQPRQLKKTAARARQPLKKTTTAKPNTTAKATGPTAKKTTTSRKSGPALHELVQGILSSDPRTVSEVVKDLEHAHPEKAGTKVQVVRNALETLVAKSRAERSKQGATVYYTAADIGVPAATVPGPAQEPVTEKVTPAAV